MFISTHSNKTQVGDQSSIRKEFVMKIVKQQRFGSGYFSNSRWRKSTEWNVRANVCEEDYNMLFRNIEKGDLENSSPMTMPVLKDVKYWSHHLRQAKGYFLLKKVLLGKDGVIYRATDGEIEEALKDTDEDDGIRCLTGAEYVFAVEHMYKYRS